MQETHCQRYQDRIVEAVTGPVPAEVMEELHAHLSGCPRCRAQWEAFSEVVARLREVPEPRVPPGFWEELDRRLQGATRGRRGGWQAAARAAGLAALVAFGVLSLASSPHPPQDTQVVSPSVQALLPQVAELARVWGAAMDAKGEPR
ncbi:MAG: zf-HC2 domain-containing protein [Armatimonadota bacterium]|nr:zf-HC2 domain-containing protein [Armatimonadota bacterium]MDW8156597.1 zf-HC2 domain-containing protein [Armatimonadota bacterium]